MSTVTTNTFAELTASGNTAAVELSGDVNKVSLYLDDAETWGSGTLKMQSSFDGGTTWVDVAGASWTSGDGLVSVDDLAFGRFIRFNLAGATSPSLTITVKAVAVASYVEVFSLTANGSTDVAITKPGAVAVFAKGTWDSGSLTLDHSPDGTLFVDAGIAAVTANGGGSFTNTAKDSLLNLVLASVASAAVLDVWVYVTAE